VWAASCGAGRKGPRGTGRDRVWSYEQSWGRSVWGRSVWGRVGPGYGHKWFLSLSPRLAVFNAPFFSLSLDLIHSSLPKLVANLEHLLLLFFNAIHFFMPSFLPNQVLPPIHITLH
jgi:hypothetical protein